MKVCTSSLFDLLFTVNFEKGKKDGFTKNINFPEECELMRMFWSLVRVSLSLASVSYRYVSVESFVGPMGNPLERLSRMNYWSNSRICSKFVTLGVGNVENIVTAESNALAERGSGKRIVKFAKYEGLGNDFILVDDRDKLLPSLSPQESARLCHRNFGVGGDGVIFALQAPSSSHDYAMRIYNSDGSEPEMCGNGIRCLAQFLHDLEEDSADGTAGRTYRIETLAGTIIPEWLSDGVVTVDMGEPTLEASRVPTTLQSNAKDGSVVEQDIVDANGKTWKVSAVSMGNPHAVIFVNDLEDDVVLDVDGPALESDVSLFPARVNVEFVQVLSPSHVRMKVWERGAGPTLACGTGACALVVAAIRAGKVLPTTDRRAPVRVSLPGGDLLIAWDPLATANRVYMTGPATFVFQGTAIVPTIS